MSTRKTYTKEFKQNIIQLNESGLSRKPIWHDYDLKPQTFDRWLKEYRRLSNKSNPEIALSDEQIRIAELEKNIRNREIAWYFKAGSLNSDKEQITVIKAIYESDNYTITELCKVFKISRETYYRYFRDKKITEQEKFKQ